MSAEPGSADRGRRFSVLHPDGGKRHPENMPGKATAAYTVAVRPTRVVLSISIAR
jgi:hypothetical protein